MSLYCSSSGAQLYLVHRLSYALVVTSFCNSLLRRRQCWCFMYSFPEIFISAVEVFTLKFFMILKIAVLGQYSNQKFPIMCSCKLMMAVHFNHCQLMEATVSNTNLCYSNKSDNQNTGNKVNWMFLQLHLCLCETEIQCHCKIIDKIVFVMK